MYLTFIETPVFTEVINKLLTDAEYRRLQAFLLQSPSAGDVIPGTAGCRKLRWRISGRAAGKRGGLRLIYFYRAASAQVFMLLAYDHRRIDDLTPQQKRQLATVIRQLR